MGKKYLAILKKDLVLNKKKLITFVSIPLVLYSFFLLVKLSIMYGNLRSIRSELEENSMVIGYVVSGMLYLITYTSFSSFQNIFIMNGLDDDKCGWSKFLMTLPMEAKTVARVKTACICGFSIPVMGLFALMSYFIMKLYGIFEAGLFIRIILVLTGFGIYMGMSTMAILTWTKSYNVGGMLSMIPAVPVAAFFGLKAFKIMEPYSAMAEADGDNTDSFPQMIQELKSAFTGFFNSYWWLVLLIVSAAAVICHILTVKLYERRV